jgi:putative solute:sodium symporter small subunit
MRLIAKVRGPMHIPDPQTNPVSHPTLSPDAAARLAESKRRYWRTNLCIMSGLLAIWAAVGFGCAIVFADVLNAYTLPGTSYPLGFWFAHQGAIMVFVFIVLAYCVLMNGLDKKHRNEMDAIIGKVKKEPR